MCENILSLKFFFVKLEGNNTDLILLLRTKKGISFL